MATDQQVSRRVEHVMGMPISLAVRGRHERGPILECAWQEALAGLREVDRTFSTWREDSIVSRLGRGEIDLLDCPPEVVEVLGMAEEARQASMGAFDVRRPGVALDPSGVVKGWAVDWAMRAFDDLDETDVCLSAGGDLVCRSRMPGSPGWRIGVEDPRRFDRILAVVPVHDGAVATSGLARRGAHVTDPRTGLAPSALASVTVVGPALTWVDIDATAALVLGEQAREWLMDRGRTAVLVRPDGQAEVLGRP